jgi:predicted acyltransferase
LEGLAYSARASGGLSLRPVTHSPLINPEDPSTKRLVSLDAYRGFIMFLLVSEAFGLGGTASNFEGSAFWDFIDYQLSHVAWVGCAFWDLIQPSFMFMVGVAMPYSYASRRRRGDTQGRIWFHVIKRALILVLLGIFLRSNHRGQTYFTFEDVLTQIGLGYAFVYLTLGRAFWVQLGAAVSILFVYWLAFALFPLPGPDFDYQKVGVPPDWNHLTGFFAHWDKNTNLAHYFDVWFLNLFPREKPFEFNGGGYLTLNFIPSMATMIFGVLAGEMLRGPKSPARKYGKLVVWGTGCLLIGLALGNTVCPIVKRIWTPSWAVYSAGWTFLMLAVFYWIIDLQGFRKWAFPLVVVGMNSIFFYCSGLIFGWWVATLETHLGQGIFEGPFGPTWEQTSFALFIWLIGYWMYKKRIFLRI